MQVYFAAFPNQKYDRQLAALAEKRTIGQMDDTALVSALDEECKRLKKQEDEERFAEANGLAKPAADDDALLSKALQRLRSQEGDVLDKIDRIDQEVRERVPAYDKRKVEAEKAEAAVPGNPSDKYRSLEAELARRFQQLQAEVQSVAGDVMAEPVKRFQALVQAVEDSRHYLCASGAIWKTIEACFDALLNTGKESPAAVDAPELRGEP